MWPFAPPINLTLPFLGTAGTTPALPHPLSVATTPFLDHPFQTEAPAVAMLPPTEVVATGGVGTDPTLLAAGVSLRRRIAVEGVNHLLVTVLGGTETTS